MDKEQYRRNLTEQQYTAVTHDTGVAVVMSSPGAGKCVVGDTLTLTDKGLCRIDQIPELYNVVKDRIQADVAAFDLQKACWTTAQASHWFDMGESPTIKITTQTGLNIQGTPEHPILVINRHSEKLAFKKISEVEIGDYCAIAINTDIWGSEPLDPDVAYLLGLLTGDGYVAQRGTIDLCRNDERILEDYKHIVSEHFSKRPIVSYYKSKKIDKGSVTHTFHSVAVWNRLKDHYGLSCTTAPYKTVPTSVLRAPKESVVQFIRGLFDTDAYVGERNFEWTTASRQLAEQIQLILFNLGIRASLHTKKVKLYPQNDYVRISISGIAARRATTIGIFRNGEEKQAALEKLAEKDCNSNIEIIPFQQKRLRRIIDTIRKSKHFDRRHQAVLHENGKTKVIRYLTGGRNPTANMIDIITRYADPHNQDVVFLKTVSEQFFFDRIAEVKDGGKQKVYDFTVPVGHNFVANGFVNHNTRVITNRIAYLIEHRHVDPANIVAVTFTNKAASEMKQRVNAMLSSTAAKRTHISTFHSLCARILRAQHEAAGIGKNYTICDDDDTEAYVTQAISFELDEDPKKVRGLKDERAPKKVKRFISMAKQELMLADDVLDEVTKDTPPIDIFYANVYKRYESILSRSNTVDFDDLIMKVVLMFHQYPEVLKKYSAVIRYLLVDEYQDTNTSQYKLVQQLGGFHKNIMVVGDVDQSIYAFRNANPRYLKKITEDYEDADLYKLEYNFRSTQTIADVANALIQNNDPAFRGGTVIKTVEKEGDPVRCLELLDPKQEAAVIVDEMLTEVRLGRAKWRDFAILYRMHSKSRVFEEMLVQNNAPHKVIGGLGFYNRAVVKDLLAYMRLVLNGADDASFIRIYDRPPRGFGDASYAKLYKQKEKLDLRIVDIFRKRTYETELKGKNLAGAHQLRETLKCLYKMPKDDVAPLIKAAAEESGYIKMLKTSGKPEDLDKLEHIDELVKAAQDFDEVHGNGLTRFLEWTSLMQTTDEQQDEDRIQLMTCHAAKGMEFKYLYVVEAVDGVIPIVRVADDFNRIKTPEQMTMDLEEERRIFYVALTRAQKRLTITHVKEQMRYNSVVDCAPSRFIEEIYNTVQHESLANTAAGSHLIARQRPKKSKGPRKQRSY